MSFREFENPWRKTFEGRATIAWSISAAWTGVTAGMSSLGWAPITAASLLSACMAVYRGKQAWSHYSFKASLAGQPFSFVKASAVKARVRKQPKKTWLGYGFEWKPVHTQRAFELMSRDVDEIIPPDWFLRMKGLDPEEMRENIGTAWIHGIEPEERDIYVMNNTLEGHTIIFGTTGAGKTRAMEVLVYQAVMRGDVVIVIDPKGDNDLQQVVRSACRDAGREHAFVFFHPAFPKKCARVDFLKNYNRYTELASRIASLIGTADSFEQFAWRAVNQVAMAQIYLEERPSLRSIRRTIEGGPDALCQRMLERFFELNVPNWEAETAQLVADSRQQAKKGGGRGPQLAPDLAAYIGYYEKLEDDIKNEAVDGLINMTVHNREHLGKILSNLVPVLTKLTAGEMGDLLSPNYDDQNDPRPIYDWAKLINGKHVVYIGLDSLSDAAVGSAVGSLALADLASVAGDRYNHGVPEDSEVQLYVDEASEVVNVPLVQILNKGRGAGFRATLFAQTLNDFVVRLGSKDAAEQMLGNFNNLIALRTINQDTQDFISSKFGKTRVQSLSRSHSTGSRSDDGGLEFQGSVSESISTQEVEIFPPQLLGRLPNLHYIGLLAGGRLIKGRLSKIQAGV